MSRKCKICSSIFRSELDNMLSKNQYTYVDIAKHFQDKGFIVSAPTVRKHAIEHTNYQFKTNEFREINQENNIDNKESLQININIDEYLKKFNLTQDDFSIEKITDISKINYNYLNLNNKLLLKLYAIVDKFVDLSMLGDFKFPIEKIKLLKYLGDLNDKYSTNIINSSEIYIFAELLNFISMDIIKLKNGELTIDEFSHEWINKQDTIFETFNQFARQIKSFDNDKLESIKSKYNNLQANFYDDIVEYLADNEDDNKDNEDNNKE